MVQVLTLLIFTGFVFARASYKLGSAFSSFKAASEVLKKQDSAEKLPNKSVQYSWTDYHDLDTTYNWLRSLEKTYPGQVSVFEVGRSYENRSILGVKISDGNEKKAIFVEGGSRPLEWISPATVTYITNQLLTSNNTEVRSLAKSYDWYIVPNTNPDGYEYTHTTDRFWRKTRSKQGKCFGVDLNSNWGFHWGENGANKDPCSNTYAGPNAFSEIEAKTLSKFLMTLKHHLFIHLSFNANNQWLFFPYGFKNITNPDYENLKRVCNAAIAGAGRRYGRKYTGGSLADVLYPMAGTSMDWAYSVLGVKYAFNYYLPPPVIPFGPLKHNFEFSAEKIIPIGEETLDSVIELIKAADKSN